MSKFPVKPCGEMIGAGGNIEICGNRWHYSAGEEAPTDGDWSTLFFLPGWFKVC